jgi:hypothetical protein
MCLLFYSCRSSNHCQRNAVTTKIAKRYGPPIDIVAHSLTEAQIIISAENVIFGSLGLVLTGEEGNRSSFRNVMFSLVCF